MSSSKPLPFSQPIAPSADTDQSQSLNLSLSDAIPAPNKAAAKKQINQAENILEQNINDEKIQGSNILEKEIVDSSDQIKFVRKVYSILACQLSISFVFILLV